MKRSSVLCLAGVCLGSLVLVQSASAEDFKVDSGHSAVIFRVKHLGVSYCYGRFNEIGGSFSFDSGSLDIEIKTSSIDSNSENRDKHLKGPDFFNVKQFPVIKFTGKKFKKIGDDEFEVSGDLTLHGVTKPLTIQLERVGSGKDPWGGYRSGFETTFTIKRTDFGMKFMTGGLGDEIRVIVSIEGIRE